MLNIIVEKIKDTKEWPFSDRIIEYKIIVSGEEADDRNIDNIIKDFCTKALTHCNSTDDEKMFYEPTGQISIIKSEKCFKIYEFKITSPYLD